MSTTQELFRSLEHQVREVSPIGYFAPGDYVCPCIECGRPFIGDKLARRCFPCTHRQSAARLSEQAAELEALRGKLAGVDEKGGELG